MTTGRHRGREFWTGRFRHKVRRRKLGFDFLDLEVDRPLPPLQVLPASLAPGRRSELLPLPLTVDGLPGQYRCSTAARTWRVEVLHPRAVEALAGVPPFGFSCEGRRFVAILPAYRDSDVRAGAPGRGLRPARPDARAGLAGGRAVGGHQQELPIGAAERRSRVVKGPRRCRLGFLWVGGVHSFLGSL